MRHLSLGLVAAGMLLAGADAANAGSSTGTMGVSITVTASCLISTTPTLSFGNVSNATLAQSGATVSGTLSYECDPTITSAALAATGANTVGSQFHMKGVNGSIPYALSNTAPSVTTSATGPTVYTTTYTAKIAGLGASTPIAGSYSDTVTVTLSF